MGIAEDLRWTAAKLANVSKFAVDSAVNESLKGGIQVYEIVKGKLKARTPSHLSNGNNKQNVAVVEEMQAKLEKMREDVYNIQQHISTCRAEEQENLKQLFDEPLKSSAPEIASRRKIFIRSRL
ncbi:hypothetical protein BUALT_Bualt03G0131700 [Buddleja alternifolia]|uniref:Uncharacterized protein n=1 Tax=Buddleja alternifolia TaxID=168488 RepID=A0AAV6XTC1_9LAMI|nr:hypothetical protein BUALT_Bualt03G0131700 [Buddleja alternifolia]